MIDNRLDEDYETLRKTVEEFARDEVAPVIGEFYMREEFPYEIVAKMGRMGLFGLPFDEQYGGMGGDYFALCLALEELARVDSSVAITLEAGVSLGAMPIYRFGTEAQKQEWLPKLCSGEMLGAFGLTEPGGGSDAGAHPHHGGARRRRVGDQRVQGVHHQLRHRHHRPGHGHRGHRHQGRRRQVDLHDHRAARHAGLGGVQEVLEGRLERLGHPRTVLRRRARAGARTCSATRPGLRPVPVHSGRRKGRHRGGLGRPRAGLRRRMPALRQGTRGVRPPDRRVPGDPVQDRRHGSPRAHRAAGLLRGSREDAARRAVQARSRDRETGRRPTRPWTTPATPPRSSAATVS